MRDHSHIPYVLITSLYYPAILGTLIFLMLNDIATIGTANFTSSMLMIVASLGIVVSFTFDYLYSLSFKEHYSLKFFLFDIVILYLLLISYNSLLKSIKQASEFSTFFSCYTVIHVIFTIWDVFVINSKDRSYTIILYDIIGSILSVVGYYCFRNDSYAAVSLLWLTTIFYFIVSKEAIFPIINDHNNG